MFEETPTHSFTGFRFFERGDFGEDKRVLWSLFFYLLANWSSTRSSWKTMPFISARQRMSWGRSCPWRGSSWWCQRTDRARPEISELTPCPAPPSSWLGTDLSTTLIKLLHILCTTWKQKVNNVLILWILSQSFLLFFVVFVKNFKRDSLFLWLIIHPEKQRECIVAAQKPSSILDFRWWQNSHSNTATFPKKKSTVLNDKAADFPLERKCTEFNLKKGPPAWCWIKRSKQELSKFLLFRSWNPDICQGFSALSIDFFSTQSRWSLSERIAVHWHWQSIRQCTLHLRLLTERLCSKEELISLCDGVLKSVYSARQQNGVGLTEREALFLFTEACWGFRSI